MRHTVCKTIGVTEICKYLWCVHHSNTDLCKTKKNPPLDGTQCGYGLGCYKGICTTSPEAAENQKANPVDGLWGDWSDWSECSTTCGWGFSYRIRLCDNPPPSNGGRNCIGEGQEFQKCYLDQCPEIVNAKNSKDKRLEQCSNVQKQQGENTTARWLPFEPEEDHLKCLLFCINDQTGEVYNLEISVLDGTPCSYSEEDDLEGVARLDAMELQILEEKETLRSLRWRWFYMP
ncbi:A disintegrin and metalloproteinase with thrombospondin motifs 3-like [Ctenocephalides felis]|uniref:A disintegrin and metalloproteinase with thrombospondin motifs 3-like n=1 Tax=Ctenocephalides felis TaxID=7515 RepID=UPI000E6E3BB1|nr:A disintegrin and metalloproteinase with thrombospondin motifs 3-like [Ctenocephalides felis]